MVEQCPHCGVRVMYGADKRCPSCRKERDAPVTEADVARAAEIKAVRAAQPALKESARRFAWRKAALGTIAFGGAAGFIGVVRTWISYQGPGDEFFIYWGWLLLGAGAVVLGLVRLVFVPSSERTPAP